MFFYIISLLFQWLALFLAGGSLSFLMFHGASIGETLGTLGFGLFVWFLGKGINALMQFPFTFKFLDTRKKRIIAAIISVAMGFLLPMGG